MKKEKKSPIENEEEIELVQNVEEPLDEELENPEDLEDDVFLELKQELEELKDENKKLKEEFLRAYADAENTKKRALQEIEKNQKYAISSFAKALLSVADNLNRAIGATDKDSDPACAPILQGIEMTNSELERVFEKFSIQKMAVLDTIFDPNFHQVVQEVEDKDKPTGTIIAELQSGYMINDRILREAMVIVTKGGK